MPELSGPFRAPSSGAAPDSLVVLLHGIGADGNDLIGLAGMLAPRFPNTAFHSPNAPEPFADAPFGFQWFPRRPLGDRAERVRGAETLVNAYIDGLLDAYALAPERCVLVGFSQGCMTALHTAPRRAAQLAGVVGMSGGLITAGTLEAEAKSRPPVILIHGDADQVVDPVETAEAGKAFAALGFEVEAHILPGLGHGIDYRALDLAAGFIERVLGQRR